MRSLLLLFFLATLTIGCTELQQSSLSSASVGSASTPGEKLSQHDAALRFLTAYVRLDQNLASKYATQQAISRLNWHRPHGANIPYYDDKMILYFNGGWARVLFQEIDGSYKVSDLEVHQR